MLPPQLLSVGKYRVNLPVKTTVTGLQFEIRDNDRLVKSCVSPIDYQLVSVEVEPGIYDITVVRGSVTVCALLNKQDGQLVRFNLQTWDGRIADFQLTNGVYQPDLKQVKSTSRVVTVGPIDQYVSATQRTSGRLIFETTASSYYQGVNFKVGSIDVLTVYSSFVTTLVILDYVYDSPQQVTLTGVDVSGAGVPPYNFLNWIVDYV